MRPLALALYFPTNFTSFFRLMLPPVSTKRAFFLFAFQVAETFALVGFFVVIPHLFYLLHGAFNRSVKNMLRVALKFGHMSLTNFLFSFKVSLLFPLSRRPMFISHCKNTGISCMNNAATG